MTRRGEHDDWMGLLARYREDQAQRGLTTSTIRRMRDNLRSFALSLPEGQSMLDATRDDVETWLASRGARSGGTISARTRYTLISCVHRFYEWAMREELVDADPTANIVRPRLRRTLPRPISDGDLQTALELAEPRMRAWLALMAYAGLRCQEVAGVRVEDLMLHLEPPMLLVAAAKGGRERTVPVAEAAELAIRSYGLPRSGPLFLTYAGRPFSPQTVSRETSEYLAAIGISATAHQLRHWFATKMYALTHDLVLVQELLGHASIATTRIYVAFDPGQAADVVRRLRVGTT